MTEWMTLLSTNCKQCLTEWLDEWMKEQVSEWSGCIREYDMWETTKQYNNSILPSTWKISFHLKCKHISIKNQRHFWDQHKIYW